MAATTQISKQGTVELPAHLRERFHLGEGCVVVTEATERGILIRPIVPDDERDLLAESNVAYEALRADPVAWAEYLAEIAVWDVTLTDGLDPTEVWDEDGNVHHR